MDAQLCREQLFELSLKIREDNKNVFGMILCKKNNVVTPQIVQAYIDSQKKRG